MKGKGFDKLRGAAVVGAAGLGSLAGGTARAGWFTAQSTTTTTSTGAIGTAPGEDSKVFVWFAYNTSNYNPALSPSASGQFTPCGTTTCFAATGFLVSEALIASGSMLLAGDLYDGAFQVAVDGVMYANPDGTYDVSGSGDKILTTHPATVSGVQVTMQLAVGVGRPGVLRVLYSFTNTSANDVVKTIEIGGNLGSDAATTVKGTADGDLDIEAGDAWYVSSDNGTGTPAPDPVFTFARYGDGPNVVTPTVTFWEPGTSAEGSGLVDFFGEGFVLPIPAGETRRILLFGEGSATLADALAGAPTYNTVSAMNSAGMFSGLTNRQRGEIVNYEVPAASGGGGGGGALGLGSLFGLGGLLTLVGLRRRKAGH